MKISNKESHRRLTTICYHQDRTAAIYTCSDEDSEDDDDENKRAGEKSNERANAASGVTTKKTAGDENRKDDTNEPSGTEHAGASRTVSQSKQKPGEATRRDDLQDSGEGSLRWVV